MQADEEEAALQAANRSSSRSRRFAAARKWPSDEFQGKEPVLSLRRAKVIGLCCAVSLNLVLPLHLDYTDWQLCTRTHPYARAERCKQPPVTANSTTTTTLARGA